MKIALYIEDGLEQIVLTPQTDTEKSILDKIHDGSRKLELLRGEFYGCRGGWMRHQIRYHGTYDSSDQSTIIVLREPEEVADVAAEEQVRSEAEPPHPPV